MKVYIGATFDLIHTGHLHALRQCRELAGPFGIVVVALNTDEFVAEFKGHPTVQKYDERAEIVMAIRYVDQVVPNTGGADSRPTLLRVRPDVIAVGPDWYSPDDSKYCRQMGFTREWLAEHGIALHYMNSLPGRSSTNLRTIARQIAAQPTPAALAHERMLDA